MNSQHSKSNLITNMANNVVRYPKWLVAISLMLMALLFTALPGLTKDTRSDAFLAADNPALVYKDKVKQIFGLSDPIVIAVINNSETGVFNPKSLELVRWLSDEVSQLENINADRVTSLSTENNITGTAEGMEVDPFYEDEMVTQRQADSVWNKVSDFPLYMGNLVANNKQATLVVAELVDEMLVEETYQKVLDIVSKAPLGDHDEIHVAGEGAIAGYLGGYIDADAQVLNPIAGLVITMIILFAFRRYSPGLLSNVIIAASVLMTLSIMAIFDVPFFVITNALPVILIGISVADSIHIYSHYFELQAQQPEADKKRLIVKTIEAMWRPITLTTLTTMAGFMGLYFAAYMPPFKYFGLYTAVGVGIAWIYSLVFLPAAMAIIKPSASKQMVELSSKNKLDGFSNVMVRLGSFTLNNSKGVIAMFSVVIITGLLAASQLTVNEDRSEEGLKIVADKTIYDALELDVLIVPSAYNMRPFLSNKRLINFIADQRKNTSWMASNCSGAFLLGKAGVLDGKRATTWAGGESDLLKAYPNIKVQFDTNVVIDTNVITSNGGPVSYQAAFQLLAKLSSDDYAKDISEAIQFNRLERAFKPLPAK